MIRGGFYVVCDGPGDEHVLSYGPIALKFDTRADAARIARHRGWSVSKTSMLCPPHRRRKLKTHEFVPGYTTARTEFCGVPGCFRPRDYATHGTAK